MCSPAVITCSTLWAKPCCQHSSLRTRSAAAKALLGRESFLATRCWPRRHTITYAVPQSLALPTFGGTKTDAKTLHSAVLHEHRDAYTALASLVGTCQNVNWFRDANAGVASVWAIMGEGAARNFQLHNFNYIISAPQCQA